MSKIKNEVTTPCLSADTAIKINHLFGVYNEGKESQFVSLCDINYEFKKEKIYFIIGNSGSGKSTLVTHFNGLLKSRYGKIEIENNYPIGKDFNIHDYFIGVINLEEFNNHPLLIKQINHFQKQWANKPVYVAAFKAALPKNLVQILFEAYFKVKTHKIKTLFSHEINCYLYLLTASSEEIEIHINRYWTLKEITALGCTKPQKLINTYLDRAKFLMQWKLANQKIKKIKRVRKTVGMVFQFPEYQLFKDTIIKDVMFGPTALGTSKSVALERAKYYLNELGIPESYLERSPFGLSGGQKRRVAIAGILAIEPDVLIFDEPTAGLDPVGEEEMLNIIKNAQQKHKTVIVITHTMDHVLKVADEVLVMNDGEIIKSGTPYEIFTDKELLTNTSIDCPKVIEVINDLTSKNEKFAALYKYQPKTTEELAIAIKEVLTQKGDS
ncbi:ATP-binding cassette domain-containing protein [Ureaplasma ceti]|uniref:ABC transporter domain-containing protein n=1 Tax=Ureaplasma ceti TaxID=3119530 RepID=A0ABP9U5Z6_9BACT